MLSYFLPQTVERISSKYNGEIKVVKRRGGYEVWVGGYQQSGSLVERIWERELKKIAAKQISTVLVLGFACGSVVGQIKKIWPDSLITGVEIDKKMLEVGKKYFPENLGEKVKILNQDARNFVLKTKKSFDFIVIDAYLGGKAIFDFEKFLKFKKSIIVYNQLIKEKNGIFWKNFPKS